MSVSVGVWGLQFHLCWNYFFGDAPAGMFTLWQRIFVSLLGLFGSVVLYSNARRLFVLHTRLGVLSQEKQRLAWDLRLQIQITDTVSRRAPPAVAVPALRTSAPALLEKFEAEVGATLSEADEFEADACTGTAAAVWRNSPAADQSKHGSESAFSADNDLQFAFVPVDELRPSSPTTPSSDGRLRTSGLQPGSPASEAGLQRPMAPTRALFGDSPIFGDRPFRTNRLVNRLAALSRLTPPAQLASPPAPEPAPEMATEPAPEPATEPATEPTEPATGPGQVSPVFGGLSSHHTHLLRGSGVQADHHHPRG